MDGSLWPPRQEDWLGGGADDFYTTRQGTIFALVTAGVVLVGVATLLAVTALFGHPAMDFPGCGLPVAGLGFEC